MSITKLFALLRMKYLFYRGDLEIALHLAKKKGWKFARRHTRLCRKIYEPWVRRKLQEAKLFDEAYYISRYVKGRLIINPFEHYIRRGIYYDLSPNSKFDPSLYRIRYMPLKSRLFPILHYAIHRFNTPNVPIELLQSSTDFLDIGSSRARLCEFQILCQTYSLDIKPHSRVLDFGCGNGETVAAMRSLGYDWHGYDIILSISEKIKRNYKNFFAQNSNYIDGAKKKYNVSNYQLTKKDYRLPYNDDTFDLIISHQVMEHVFNLEETHKELMRILKPGGTAIHIYPSKECFLERHYTIPLGHRLHYKWYFNLWALLGFCGRHRQGASWRERGELGFEYISTATNYITIEQMRNICKKYFNGVSIEPYLRLRPLNIHHIIWRRIFLKMLSYYAVKGDNHVA